MASDTEPPAATTLMLAAGGYAPKRLRAAERERHQRERGLAGADSGPWRKAIAIRSYA